MSGPDLGEQAELAAKIDELLDQLLIGSDPEQAMRARKLVLAGVSVAVYGADSDVSDALVGRVEDWLNGHNALHGAQKTGLRRRVWEFVVKQKAVNPKYLRGENHWSKAAEAYNLSVGVVKHYYYEECKGRAARGSPRDMHVNPVSEVVTQSESSPPK